MKTVKLGDVAAYQTTKVPVIENLSDRYVTTENLQPNKNGVVFPASSFPAEGNINVYHTNDILISNIRPYFKKIWQAKFDGTHSTDVLNIRTITPQLTQDYLYFILSDNAFFDYVTATAKGTKMPRGDKEAIMQYEFNLPSIDTQQKISSIGFMIENKISINKSINDNLVELAITMFKEMFPRIQYGDNQIGDYIVPKRGKNLTSKNAVIGKIPVIAGGLSPATWHNKANTKKPVITISASGANAGFVNLWTIPVWSSDSAYIDSTMTDTPYFWYIMLKVRQSEIFDLQTGSAQPHIYPKHIAGLSTIKLTLANMRKYEDRVAPLFDKYASNLSEINTLSNLRDTLLPKLLNGEIELN